MSRAHDEFAHVIEAWLDASDVSEDPEAVLDRVIDRLDATPQVRNRWSIRRTHPVNNLTRIALAAAAVVAIAIVAINLTTESQPSVGGLVPTDTPPTAAETPAASCPPDPGARPLSPGRQVVDDVTPFQISFTPPESPESWWGTAGWWSISQAPTGWAAHSLLACDQIGSTDWSVIGFTTREVPACAFDGDRVDVTIDGFAGVRNGSPRRICSHANQVLDALSAPNGRGLGNLLTAYALDIDGEELVIYAWTDAHDAARHEALQTIAESVQIERP